MISTPNLEQAKNLIKRAIENKEKPIIVKAQNPEFNRKILEYGNFDILLSIESTAQNKDTSKYINSGLNHILAKIAAKNNIALGIDLKKIQSLEKKQKAIMLSKIIQNIKICRKAKTSLKLINYKDKKTAFSFFISLGASTQQAKNALEIKEKLI